jgi:hypothetical protein
MMGRRLGWTLSLLVVLHLTPGATYGQERSGQDLQQFLRSLQRAQGPLPAARVQKPTAQEKTVNCYATCGPGSSVSVTCSGSCMAVDQNCDAGVQGYVQCSGGTRQDCAPCERCTAWTYCPDNGSVQCSGWYCDDFGHGLCNVMCDGYHYFCPGHFGEEVCW